MHRCLREERGATMVEYAVMLGLVAAVCIAAVTIIGTKTGASFTDLNGLMP